MGLRYLTIPCCMLLLICGLAHGQQTYVDSLKQWLKDHPTVDSAYILTLHRISYRTSEKDIQTSFRYYEKVNTLSNELDFTYGKALAQINLGILLSNSANFEASNDAYFKAIAFAEKAGAPRIKAISLNNIGENFRSLKDWNRCREYTLQAVDINRKLEAWRGVAINYELLHQCDLAENLFEAAKRHLDRGFSYAILSKDSYIISLYYLGYAKIESVRGNVHRAEYFFDKAMAESNLQNDLRNKYYVYMARAEYMKTADKQRRISYLDSAYQLATATSFLEGVGKAAHLLSEFYDEQAEKDSSLKYFHIYRMAYDSIFSENNKRNVVIKEFDWMIKQKEIENKHLQDLAKIQKKDIDFKNVLLFASIILLLLTGAVAFFAYKNIRTSRKREVSEFEKQMLSVKMASLQSQMNPHFIFNSLNSIENFVMQNDKLAASQYLNKFASLVRTILESSNRDSVPFAIDWKATQTYIELERLRFNNKFDVITNIDNSLLGHEYHVPPMVIQPYIENAIIHGLAPSEKEDLYLKIEAYVDNGYIHYVVEDNGIGRELAREYRRVNGNGNESIGMKLTQEKMDIYSKKHNTEADIRVIDLYTGDVAMGTKIILRIKITNT